MSLSEPRLLVSVDRRNSVGEQVAEHLPEVAWAYLRDTPPERRQSVEAMLVGGYSRELTEFDPATTPRLRFVQRLFTGTDGFPFRRFPADVRFAGNIGAFAPFVSEHAVMLALAAARDLPAGREMVREGRLRPAPEQRSLAGRTAVILGYGEIGRAIADRLRPFDTRLVGVNRRGEPAAGVAEMFPAERFREALPLGDFVFEVRPLTNLTAGSIGAAELASMRPDAILVNVGRAGTVDEEALFRHLETHPRFRAAIDVWWNERFSDGTLPSRFPFGNLPNVVGTPHSAGNVPGADERAIRFAAENLARFFRTGTPAHVLDRSEYPA